MDFIGNKQARTYFEKYIEHISTAGNDRGFLLLCGPQYIGKMTLIESVIDKLVEPEHQLQDLIIIKDLSDQRIQLKEHNDKLTGTSHTIKIEADPNKIDIKLSDGTRYKDYGIREVLDWLGKSPIGKRKLLVIENIERMTIGASNAFLKTLEEPLEDRIIICTCSNPQQLLPTIVSRGILINFYEDAEADGLGLGRAGIQKRIAYDPVFKTLDENLKIVDAKFLKESLLSTQQALFQQANDLGVLDLFISALQVKFVDDPHWSAKFLQAKKYLDSNIGINSLLLDMLLK